MEVLRRAEELENESIEEEEEEEEEDEKIEELPPKKKKKKLVCSEVEIEAKVRLTFTLSAS